MSAIPISETQQPEPSVIPKCESSVGDDEVEPLVDKFGFRRFFKGTKDDHPKFLLTS